MTTAVLPSTVRSPAESPYRPDTERAFYQAYDWCLNPFPTIGETVKYLRGELDRLGVVQEPWQLREVMTNVFLLSGALVNAVDEYLRGTTLRLPRKLAGLRPARAARWAIEKLAAARRCRRRVSVRHWRDNWLTRLDDFLTHFVSSQAPDATSLVAAGRALGETLRLPLPADLQSENIYFPSAFRRLDLTHFDILALGRRFVARFPDRSQPILALGLRTAGAYFAPLLRAYLRTEGYSAVAVLTVHPVKGPGARESADLTRYAREGHRAVLLDDPPHSGDTILQAVDMARRLGFAGDRVAALLPAHHAHLEWSDDLSPSGAAVVSLAPDEWHKHRLLEVKAVEGRLTEYFVGRGFVSVSVRLADQFNAQLQSQSDDVRRTRLKNVYEVRLNTQEGDVETRYVLAKSVGWGWLSYHAYLAGNRLAGSVPPVLGLRDGILYSEWLPPEGPASRAQWIATTASYVAARARSLGLGANPLPGFAHHRHHDGFRLLEKVASRAFGGPLTAALRRPHVRRRLSQLPCPHPTLIDGKMRRAEWIAGPHGLLKTDYEHHGLGKNELNAIDPVYDLADAVLQLDLTPADEAELIHAYITESGDSAVEARLFPNKFLAGTWALTSALKGLLQQPRMRDTSHEYNRQFIAAWHFLTVQTARFCGSHCRPPLSPHWRTPLAVLDIDGVVDRRFFGFPCTTAAGIQALALLHGHDYTVAVDTARSVAEVQEYCRAYGLAGGVAESGSYIWDAVGQRGRALVDSDGLHQLERARTVLAQVPGVFLDDRYQHSIRAHTFEDKNSVLSRGPITSLVRAILSASADDVIPVPLPTLTVRQLLVDNGLDRLTAHQTTIDTTILARDVDKGRGLTALLDWVGLADADVTAVGDSEPDLAMFRVARRSFAPAHMSCARQARLLGCQIAREPYQRGLLSSVRSLLHPNGGTCTRCSTARVAWSRGQDLFLDLLSAADRKPLAAFCRALFDPEAYQLFLR